MTVMLYHFLFSPYNEKVRWALDVKGVAHSRRALLPGPHMATTRRISGQTQTPVLVVGGRAVAGSAGILDELDRLYPTPALTPATACLAHAAYEIESLFDDTFVPRMRRALLARLLDHPDYLVKVFGRDHAVAARIAYRSAVPFAGGMIRKGNGISGTASVADGDLAIKEALDYVSKKRGARTFLVGEALSRADIAAASAIAAITSPAGTPMERPGPEPSAITTWLAHFREHPSAIWTKTMLQQYRKPAGQEHSASAA